MKPGIKTTEFYACLSGIGTVLLGFINQNCSLDDTKLLGLFGLIATYIVGRSYLKAKSPVAQGGQA